MSSAWIPPLQAFHTIDQKAYARLMDVGFEPGVSKKIVAFWLWLETKDCRNFVLNTLILNDRMLLRLALETITCLENLKQGVFYAFNDALPTMRWFLGRPISLDLIYRNKEDAEMKMKKFINDAEIKMKKFMNDVCNKAFNNEVPVTLSNGAPWFMPACQFAEPRVLELAQEHYAAQGQVNQEHHEAQEGQEDQDSATKQQIEEYFVGKYGKDLVDCIPKDLLYMLA